MDFILEEEHYRLLFENSLDAILFANPRGRIFRANPAACSMFNKTEAEICRDGRAGIFDLGDPKLALALRDREKKGRARGELTFIKGDGSKFTADYTSTIFKDRNGVVLTAMIIRDITDYKQAVEGLQRSQEESMILATYDYLTGAMNRRSFVERLKNEMNRSSREKSPLCLIMMDIDLFKEVNDNYGHLSGDMVLKQFSQSLLANLRPYDVVGRFGGDEFIVCLPNTNLKEAASIAERLRISIGQLEIYHDTRPIRITASLGVALYDAKLNEDTDAFISRVDNYMYLAKKTRNSIFCETD